MHPIREMIEDRNNGEILGIPSYCTANEMVIEAILERAKQTGIPALIEATANQVNQFGGYTGMKPQDFAEFMIEQCKKVGVSKDLLILGGDHLGPLTWKTEDSETAMEKSKELVTQYVLAGFTKIHLDTSMKLGDDDKNKPLETAVIASRGAQLYQCCMNAYAALLKKDPNALRPVFVIGSEVPIPGGATEEEEGIVVTTPENFEDTVSTYKRVFKELGCENAWDDVVAVVVQPGVEFGDEQVFLYESEEARALCEQLKSHKNIVFEGHSTDYQTKESLRKMVADGIAILKVGPALTFGLRDALFSLSMIEKEIVPVEEQAYFMEILDRVMKKEPKNWQDHYHGDDKTITLARKYSYSDRSRYYIGDKEVVAAIEKLFDNLDRYKITMNILLQYMPVQYQRIRAGILKLNARNLAKDSVVCYMEDYEYASYGAIDKRNKVSNLE